MTSWDVKNKTWHSYRMPPMIRFYTVLLMAVSCTSPTSSVTSPTLPPPVPARLTPTAITGNPPQYIAFSVCMPKSDWAGLVPNYEMRIEGMSTLAEWFTVLSATEYERNEDCMRKHIWRGDEEWYRFRFQIRACYPIVGNIGFQRPPRSNPTQVFGDDWRNDLVCSDWTPPVLVEYHAKEQPRPVGIY